MPVSVVIPIRVRLDLGAHIAAPSALSEAVQTATIRALGQVRDNVFKPRGGFATPRLSEPSITFYGAGLGHLDASSRLDIETAIRQAVARAAQAVELDTGRTHREGAPDVMETGAVARFDPSRAGLMDTAYVVDSYGSDDRRPERTVVDKQGGRRRSPPPAPRQRRRLITGLPRPHDLLDKAGDYLGAVLRAHFPGGYRQAAPIGVLFRHAETQREWLAVFDVRFDAGRLVVCDSLVFHQSLAGFGVDSAGDTVPTSAAAAGTVIKVHEVVPGRIDDEEDLVSYVADFYEQHKTLDDLLKGFNPQDPAVTTLQHTLHARHKAGGRRGIYEGFARDLVSRVYHGGGCRLFQVIGRDDLVLLAANFPALHALTIVPLLEDAVANARNEAADKKGDLPRADGMTVLEDEEDKLALYLVDGIGVVEVYDAGFQGEPRVDALGVAGHHMAGLMARIARLLRMTDRTWDYAGAFAINAARVMTARSGLAHQRAAGELASIKPARYQAGNAGDADVEISASPAIEMLQTLGKAAPLLEQLDALVLDMVASSPLRRPRIGTSSEASWALHYRREFMPACKSSVYAIFTETCRVCLLQLLGASGAGLAWLDADFDAYFRSVERFLLGPVARLAALRRMREHILQAEAGNFAGLVLRAATGLPLRRPAPDQRTLWTEIEEGAGASARVGFQAWREAREWWRDDGKLDTIGRIRRETSARENVQGTIVQQPDGSFAVAEGEDGRLWTREDLESAIRFQEGALGTFDPLVRHMTNLEGSVAAFQNSSSARAYVRRLIERMQKANADAVTQTHADVMFAFRTAKLGEDWQSPQTAAGVTMRQLHALAHRAVGPAFADGWIYREGLQFLFGSEKGRDELLPVLELFVTIGAFALCGPLGLAVSAVAAGIRYDLALAHEAVSDGLMEADEVLSRADAELEMFMSHFEIALLILPESGNIARRVASGYRAAFSREVKAGAGAAAAKIRARMLQEFGTALKGELMQAFVHQLVAAKALEPLLGAALTPVFEVLRDEAAFGAGPPMPEAVANRLMFLAEYGDVDIELKPLERLEDRP